MMRRARSWPPSREHAAQHRRQQDGGAASNGEEYGAAQQRTLHRPGDARYDAGDPDPAGDDTRARGVERAGDDEAEHGAELKRIGKPWLTRLRRWPRRWRKQDQRNGTSG